MFMNHTCNWCPQRPEEDVIFLGTEVTDGCKPPRVYWEVNPGPLEEHVLKPLSQPPPNQLVNILKQNSFKIKIYSKDAKADRTHALKELGHGWAKL